MSLKQKIKLNQPGSQLTLNVGVLNIPALAVPQAWLLQLYAALDNQPNSLSIDTLKQDLRTIFVRHTSLVEADLQSLNKLDTYDYTITLKDDEGRLSTEELTATDDDHAREESGYEFDETVVAVQRGERIPDSPPWHEWP